MNHAAISEEVESQAAEHGMRRDQSVRRTAIASFIAKLVTSGSGLIQVPLAIGFFGPEAFGFWSTITGMVTLLAFSDLGMGNGAQNRVANHMGKENWLGIARVRSTGVILLTMVSSVLLVVIGMVVPLVQWETLFNLRDVAVRAEARSCVFVILVSFCVNLPLQLLAKVGLGLQLGWINNVWVVIGSLLGLLMTCIAVLIDASIPTFLALTLSAPILGTLGLAFRLNVILKQKGVRWAAPDVMEAKYLFRFGSQFMVPQIGAMLIMVFPAALLSMKLGAEAVAPYFLVQRLLAFTTQALGFLLNPLWPAYAEASARGDLAWVRSTFRRSIVFTGVVGLIPCAIFAVGGGWISSIWSGMPMSSFSPGLICALSGWIAMINLSQPFAMVLNGLGFLSGQATYGFGSAVLSLCAMKYAIGNYGPTGVPLACIVFFGAINLPLTVWEAFCRVQCQEFPPSRWKHGVLNARRRH